MGTLTTSTISTTFKNLIFTDKTSSGTGDLYYTKTSDNTDIKLTTFTSALSFAGLITATLGIKLTNNIIYASDGHEGIKLTATGSAVNFLSVVNSATTDAVGISTGGETNVGLTLDAKGSGIVTCTPNLVVTGDVIITGADIKSGDASSSTTAMTLSSANVTVAGDLTVSGGDITATAGEGVAASLMLQADESDDAGDDWKMIANINQTLTIGNDIASAGSFVNHLTITPHATIANSYITIPGKIRTTKLDFTDGSDAITIGASGVLTIHDVVTFNSNLVLNGATNLSMANSSTTSLNIKQASGASYLSFDTTNAITTAGQTLHLDGNTGPANGAGIDSGSAPIRHYSWVEKIGGIFKTSIYVDLDGLASTTTDLDVIGLAAGGAAHLGAITQAGNGTIFAVKMTCLDTPTTGADEIDLWNADEATMVYDNPIESTSSTEHEIIKDSGAWTTGVTKGATHTITMGATEYLYLTAGEAGTAAEYGKGKFLIELWGA